MREKFKRFDKYMKFKGLNDNQVSRQCNLSQGLIGQARSGKSDLGTKTIDKILSIYQDLNKFWLLTGEGEMLIDQRQEEEGTIIPLLPISAQGGSLNDFIVSVKGSECEKVLSPVRGADFAITVAGDSMVPEYPNGSQVHIKKINEQAFIEWGKVYVLDTCNGVVIKRVVPSEREGYVRCLSINTNPIYAPFDVAMTDIYGIYRVMLCLSIK